jgi:hypothetical protein
LTIFGTTINNLPMRAIVLPWFAAMTFLAAAIPDRAAEAPGTFKVGEFTFTRPAGWEWVEATSSMRKAQLKVPGPDRKESAEVVFFYFGEGSGGGARANVDRWLGQFEGPKELQSKVEEVTVGKRQVTYVEAEGTYLSGMPGGPKTLQPNSMLLGAILASPEGDVFIKLTGPAVVAKAAKDAFRRMVEGPLK